MMENSPLYHYGNQPGYNQQQWYSHYDRQPMQSPPAQEDYSKPYGYNPYCMENKTYNYNGFDINNFHSEDVKSFPSCMVNRQNDFYREQKERYENCCYSNDNKSQGFSAIPETIPKHEPELENKDVSKNKLKAILNNMNDILKSEKKCPKTESFGFESLFINMECGKEAIKPEPISSSLNFNSSEISNTSPLNVNNSMDKDDNASSSPHSFSSPQIYPWMKGGIGDFFFFFH